MNPIFPPLPENLAELTDEQVNALIAERVELAKQVKARDEDLLKGRDTAAVVAELKQAGVDVKTLRDELATREQAEADADAAIDDILGEIEAEADKPADDADEDTLDADADADVKDKELEPVLAAGRPIRTKRVEPTPEKQELPARTTVIVASGGIDGFAEGYKFQSGSEIARALVSKRANMVSTPEGVEEKVRVARVMTSFDADRVLPQGDAETTWNKIQAVVGPNAVGLDRNGNEALIASGGLCAPVEPYYDLQLIATDKRPIRDAFPRFNAQRGGIRYMTPPGLAAVTTGVGYLTAAQDGTGGTTGAKSCQQVGCPAQTEVDVAMIYQCLRFGNLGSRAWPEQVTHFEGLTAAARARLAETKLLDAMHAASIEATGAQVAGANSTLLGQILMAAAGQRSRNRMDENAVLRVVLPAWTRELLVVDMIRSQFQRFEQSINGVATLLRTFNVEPVFSLDGSSTPGGQVFGAQANGALLTFPSTVQWWIFPEGSFLYLDAGVLDVGLVRDSTLNLSNDFQMFEENFENLAFVGVESLEVISTVCPNGQTTAPVTASGCAA